MGGAVSTDSLELIVGAGAEVSGLGLDELEVIIERTQESFMECGRAVMEIRDRRLYEAEGYANFKAYLRLRWNWGVAHAYRLMDSAATVAAIESSDSPIGELPTNEHQARQMLNRLTPEERDQVRKGTAMPETVARMVSPAPRDRVTDPRLPRRDAAKMLPNLVSQVNGIVHAVRGIDFTGCVPESYQLTQLDAGIRTLVAIRRTLKEGM